MNSRLPSGVANYTAKSLENCANGPHPALGDALRAEINQKPVFAWEKRARRLRFSANS